MSDKVKSTIKRVGDKYKEAPRTLRITIGQILEGKVKLKMLGGKSNE